MMGRRRERMEIGGTARQSVLMEVRTSRRRYLARGSCGSTKYWDIRFRFCARELRNFLLRCAAVRLCGETAGAADSGLL